MQLGAPAAPSTPFANFNRTSEDGAIWRDVAPYLT